MRFEILFPTLFLATLSVPLSLLFSCNKSTEPIQYLRLVIENGFYSKVESTNSNEIQYEIEFTYFVQVEECNWGGYSIEMDSHAWSLDLYKMQRLRPNEKHTIIDTFRVNNELRMNPIVRMQAYRIGSSESYNELYAEYILQPKPY